MEPISLTQIILGVLSVLGAGGGIAAYFSYKQNRSAQESIDFSSIIKTWQEDNERLRIRERENARKIYDLQQEVSHLRSKVLLLESATQDLPIPMWLKDMDGTMLALNPAYEQIFLIPHNKTMKDYIGKQDVDVWPEEISKAFKEHDEWVKANRSQLRVYENVPLADGTVREYFILKYPRYSGKTMIGVAGIAVDSKLTKRDAV